MGILPTRIPRKNKTKTKINMKKKLLLIVIGLGYVGLPLAIAFGKKVDVVGFDTNADRINELSNGYDRNGEFGASCIRSASRLTLVKDNEELLCLITDKFKVFIVTVPTPINHNKEPDLEPLKKASEYIARFIDDQDIVIYESTVYPGVTEDICAPIIENISGLRYLKNDNKGRGFYCGYSPERINPGDKNRQIKDIVKVTSGSTEQCAVFIDKLYKKIIDAGTFRAASIRVAEAAKVIENTQRDLNIALFNELSMIFERLGLDTSDVIAAAETKWNFVSFKPGLVGGHCIGVDPYYLAFKAKQVGFDPQVILAGRRTNDLMPKYVAERLVKTLIRNKVESSHLRVAIHGLTFKENCSDIRNSKVIELVKELENWSVLVTVEDPRADPFEVKALSGLTLETVLEKGIFDALVIAVAHDEYRSFTPEYFSKVCRSAERGIIVDIKAMFDRERLESLGFTVIRL